LSVDSVSSDAGSGSVDFGGYEYDPSVDMSGYIPLSERMKVVSVSYSDIEIDKQSILFPVVESKVSSGKFYDFVSLKDVRTVIKYDGFNMDFIINQYHQWLNIPFYPVLKGWNPLKGDFVFKYFRSSKRGDFRYACRVERRFDMVTKSLPDIEFFTYGVHGHVESPCLEVTLTFDPKKISLQDAWVNIGRFENVFLAGLREHYGHKVGGRRIDAKINVTRVWESHKDGFPHVHLIILFLNHFFKGFSHVVMKGTKKGGLDYLVGEREGDRKEVDKIAEYWKGGFIKVKLMSSLKGGFRYQKKYLTKSVSADETEYEKSHGSIGLKTLACCWVFRKRSFGISGSWGSAYNSITVNRNSNRFVPFVACFDGSKLYVEPIKWSLFGFYKGDNVLLKAESSSLLHSEVQFLREDLEHFRLYEGKGFKSVKVS